VSTFVLSTYQVLPIFTTYTCCEATLFPSSSVTSTVHFATAEMSFELSSFSNAPIISDLGVFFLSVSLRPNLSAFASPDDATGVILSLYSLMYASFSASVSSVHSLTVAVNL